VGGTHRGGGGLDHRLVFSVDWKKNEKSLLNKKKAINRKHEGKGRGKGVGQKKKIGVGKIQVTAL